MWKTFPGVPPEDLIKSTKLFKHFSEIREDIEKHKWYESEKAGRDIGWDRAIADWIIKGYSKKFSNTHCLSAK